MGFAGFILQQERWFVGRAADGGRGHEGSRKSLTPRGFRPTLARTEHARPTPLVP
jgi:hypothetical protein